MSPYLFANMCNHTRLMNPHNFQHNRNLKQDLENISFYKINDNKILFSKQFLGKIKLIMHP